MCREAYLLGAQEGQRVDAQGSENCGYGSHQAPGEDYQGGEGQHPCFRGLDSVEQQFPISR